MCMLEGVQIKMYDCEHVISRSVHKHVCTHIYIHIHMPLSVYIYICTYVSPYIHIHKCIYIYIYVCNHLHNLCILAYEWYTPQDTCYPGLRLCPTPSFPSWLSSLAAGRGRRDARCNDVSIFSAFPCPTQRLKVYYVSIELIHVLVVHMYIHKKVYVYTYRLLCMYFYILLYVFMYMYICIYLHTCMFTSVQRIYRHTCLHHIILCRFKFDCICLYYAISYYNLYYILLF